MIGATNQFATRADAAQTLLSAYYPATSSTKLTAQSDTAQKTAALSEAASSAGDKVSISAQAYQRLQNESSTRQSIEQKLEAIRTKATKSPSEMDLLIHSDQRLSSIFARSPHSWTADDIEYVEKAVVPANIPMPTYALKSSANDAPSAAPANSAATNEAEANTAPRLRLIHLNSTGRSTADNLKMYAQTFGASAAQTATSSVMEKS